MLWQFSTVYCAEKGGGGGRWQKGLGAPAGRPVAPLLMLRLRNLMAQMQGPHFLQFFSRCQIDKNLYIYLNPALEVFVWPPGSPLHDPTGADWGFQASQLSVRWTVYPQIIRNWMEQYNRLTFWWSSPFTKFKRVYSIHLLIFLLCERLSKNFTKYDKRFSFFSKSVLLTKQLYCFQKGLFKNLLIDSYLCPINEALFT